MRSKEMRGSRETLPGEVCYICGDIGFVESLLTCFGCKRAREHKYCMPANLQGVVEVWFCEACRSIDDIVSPEAPISNTFGISSQENKDPNALLPSKIAPHDTLLSVGPVGLLEGDGKGILYKKQKNASKVKFIPTEEAAMLASGAETEAVALQGSLGSQAGLSNAMPFTSNISRTDPPNCFPERRILDSNLGPSVHSKTLTCGSEHYISQQQINSELNTSKVKSYSPLMQLRGTEPMFGVSGKPKKGDGLRLEKETPVIPSNMYVCKEEAIDATTTGRDVGTSNAKTEGGTFPADVQLKISEVQEKDNPGILTKFGGDCSNLPALGATWRGSFKILDMDFSSKSYDGLRAHPPSKVSRKAYEASKRLPEVLQFYPHPRHNLWPEIFRKDSPAENDIAIYFFPSEFGRFKKEYLYLLEFVEIHDLAMRSYLDGVELLIFTSKQLPVDSQRLNMQFYLWGVFRRVKGSDAFFQAHTPFPPGLVTLNANHSDGGAIVDKEIDTVGGGGVGRIDKLVQKPCEGNNVQFKFETRKGKDQIKSQGHVSSSNALNLYKNNDRSYTRGTRITTGTGSHDNTIGSSHCVRHQLHGHWTKEETTIPQCLANVKREQLYDLDVPLGFSGQDLQNLQNSPLKVQAVSSLDAPPGFPQRVTSFVNREDPLLDSTAKVPTGQGQLDVSPRFCKPRKKEDKNGAYDVNEEKEKAPLVDKKRKNLLSTL